MALAVMRVRSLFLLLAQRELERLYLRLFTPLAHGRLFHRPVVLPVVWAVCRSRN
jgi:hypothetical protein